jgi:hypothetical protein
MIDNELDQLSRALIAATDRLNSQDFKDRQAKYVQMEQEFLALGSELEAEERAVEKAQVALQQHVAVTYLDAEIFEDAPDPTMPEEDRKFYSGDQWGSEPFVPALGTGPEGSAMPFAILDDEYASAKSNGALTD